MIAVQRGMMQFGWHPVRDFQAAVQRASGVAPREGELIKPHLARACGCSLDQVERFFAMLNAGHTQDEIDQAIFGESPSRVTVAMRSVERSIRDFAQTLAAIAEEASR